MLAVIMIKLCNNINCNNNDNDIICTNNYF